LPRVSTRFLDANAPVAAKQKSSGVINFNKEKPFSQIVTWSLTVP
jgi:hypothetical protein